MVWDFFIACHGSIMRLQKWLAAPKYLLTPGQFFTLGKKVWCYSKINETSNIKYVFRIDNKKTKMLRDAGKCWEMLADSGLRCSARMSGVAWRHFETLRDTCRCSETFGNTQRCSETFGIAQRCLETLRDAWRCLAEMIVCKYSNNLMWASLQLIFRKFRFLGHKFIYKS